MLKISLMDWWKAMGSTDQAFLSVAIVSTLLLAMLIGIHLMGLEQETEPSGKVNTDRKRHWFDARMLLVFCTLCSWLTVAFIFAKLSILFSLLFAVLITAPLTFFGRYLIKKWLTPAEDVNNLDLLLQTGEVLQYIPPHRNGFGKVHFSLPEAPFQIEAITAGQELSPGSHVRVVDIIDDRIILVEPIDEEYPGQGIDR